MKNIRAAAALAAVLLIGGIIIETAIASLLASYLVSQEGLGTKLSRDATLVARSGANDAIMAIVREGDAVSTGSYALDVGTWTTQVQITSTALVTGDVKYTITSTASVLNKQSTITAIVIVDHTTQITQINSIIES